MGYGLFLFVRLFGVEEENRSMEFWMSQQCTSYSGLSEDKIPVADEYCFRYFNHNFEVHATSSIVSIDINFFSMQCLLHG